MIVYDLRCRKSHVFEGWFANSDAYEAQAKAGKIVCPACGSTRIAKALMAPAVAGAKPRDEAAAQPAAESAGDAAGSPPEIPAGRDDMANYLKALKALRHHVERNCDYVGGRFPEEARKMHYGETDRRNIYGEASEGEAKALTDEGIELNRVPWLPNQDA